MSEPVIYVPLRVERAAVRRAGRSVRLVRTGMGPHRATAARARTAGADPALVAGLAGGLAPHVRPGDIVVADEVRGGPDGVTVPSAPLLAGALRRAGLTVHIGPVLSSPRIVRAEPGRSWAAGDAIATDMESAWLAGPGAPFAVVRAVVDTADHPLPSWGTTTRGIRALRALRECVPALEQWAGATGHREVVLAGPRSFCAGVARAIDIVARALDRYGAPVYVRRQIVHNGHVVDELQQQGAVFVDEVDEVPPGGRLVFAAHGVSPAVRREAAERGLSVLDATCPLVSKVHTEIRRYAGRGDTVLLIGHADHEEVEGSVGEAPADVIVVESVEQARQVQPRDPARVSYTMQTTLAVDEAEEIAAILRDRFPTLTAPRSDDICYATTNRQNAVRAVAAQVDLMLVVGSTNSSNSRRLVEVAERAGVPAYLVEDVGGVDLCWLSGVARIGLTAGASAPPHLVEEIVHALTGLGAVQVREERLLQEAVTFALPKEVS